MTGMFNLRRNENQHGSKWHLVPKFGSFEHYLRKGGNRHNSIRRFVLRCWPSAWYVNPVPNDASMNNIDENAFKEILSNMDQLLDRNIAKTEVLFYSNSPTKDNEAGNLPPENQAISA